jgi:hypothetical protein
MLGPSRSCRRQLGAVGPCRDAQMTSSSSAAAASSSSSSSSLCFSSSSSPSSSFSSPSSVTVLWLEGIEGAPRRMRSLCWRTRHRGLRIRPRCTLQSDRRQGAQASVGRVCVGGIDKGGLRSRSARSQTRQGARASVHHHHRQIETASFSHPEG